VSVLASCLAVDEDSRTVARQIAAVIAWELDAQAGVGRVLDAVPELVADSLLDFFDVQVKPRVTVPERPSLASYELQVAPAS
jgi:hypothetical protein